MAIVDNIKTTISTSLGSSYSELNHVYDVSKNTFKGSSKRYGIIEGSITEIAGILRHINLQQEFEVKITNSYSVNNLNDASVRTCISNLLVVAKSLYKDLVNTRCGDSSILLVSDLNIPDAEILSEDRVIIISLKFNIKYRNSL